MYGLDSQKSDKRFYRKSLRITGLRHMLITVDKNKKTAGGRYSDIKDTVREEEISRKKI